MSISFEGRLGIQQRVLPDYRVRFFDLLAQSCSNGLSLFAGLPRRDEGILNGQLKIATYVAAQNIHFLSGSFYLCYQKGLVHWLEDWNPDALILEANPRYPATPAAVRWMHRRERKVLGWGLGAPSPSGFPHFLRKWGKRQRRAFLSQFDALIAYSQRGADEYAALGFPNEKIFVAHNAVALKPSTPLPQRPASIDRPTVLFVGRLQSRKRVDLLLHACAGMPEPRPNLVIVGDGPERQGFESLAKQVYPSAEFIGAKHEEELKPYFMSADIFVLPGTGGLAVQEAMSYGLPIIVAKGDGTQDDLVRAGNGWQVTPDRYDELVSTLQLALADLPRLRKMGAESYRIVSDEINLERMVEVFLQALSNLK